MWSNSPGCPPSFRVIDVGTGSGALAITLACESPELEIEATDSSREALQVAAANCVRHGVRERVRLVQGDLLSGFRRGFAAVVANLPYVPSGAFAELSPEVRVYEPRLALDGGPDGLREVRRVIDQASEALVVCDLAGVGRVVLAKHSGTDSQPPSL